MASYTIIVIGCSTARKHVTRSCILLYVKQKWFHHIYSPNWSLTFVSLVIHDMWRITFRCFLCTLDVVRLHEISWTFLWSHTMHKAAMTSADRAISKWNVHKKDLYIKNIQFLQAITVKYEWTPNSFIYLLKYLCPSCDKMSTFYFCNTRTSNRRKRCPLWYKRIKTQASVKFQLIVYCHSHFCIATKTSNNHRVYMGQTSVIRAPAYVQTSVFTVSTIRCS